MQLKANMKKLAAFILSLSFLAPFTAFAAVAGVNYEDMGSAFTSGSFTSGSGTHMAVFVCATGSSAPTSVTYGGNSMTLLVSNTSGSAGQNQFLYGLANAPTGGNTLAVSPSSTYEIIASSFSGVSSSIPDATGSHYLASASSITTSVTTVASNVGIVACGSSSASNPTQSTGLTTQILSFLGNQALFTSSTFPIVSPTTYSMTMTGGGTTGQLILIAASMAPYVSPAYHIYDIITSWCTWFL